MKKLILLAVWIFAPVLSHASGLPFKRVASTAVSLVIVKVNSAKLVEYKNYNKNIHTQLSGGIQGFSQRYYTESMISVLHTELQKKPVSNMHKLSICAQQKLLPGSRYVAFLYKHHSKACRNFGYFFRLIKSDRVNSGLAVELTEDNALSFPKDIPLTHTEFYYKDISKGKPKGDPDIVKSFVDFKLFVAQAKKYFTGALGSGLAS